MFDIVAHLVLYTLLELDASSRAVSSACIPATCMSKSLLEIENVGVDPKTDIDGI